MAQGSNRGEQKLGLELETSVGTRYAMFQPGDERAFVVGSSQHAELRLPFPGVAAVEFHIERDRDQLNLLPASGTQRIVVNGRRVIGVIRLADENTIDFSGQRIIARIFDATGVDGLEVPLEEKSGIAYIDALPSENAPTRLGLPEDDTDDNLPTVALVRNRGTAGPELLCPEPRREPATFEPRRAEKYPLSSVVDEPPFPDAGLTERIDLRAGALVGPNGTEILRRADLLPVAPAGYAATADRPASKTPARSPDEGASRQGHNVDASSRELPASLLTDTTEIELSPIAAKPSEPRHAPVSPPRPAAGQPALALTQMSAPSPASSRVSRSLRSLRSGVQKLRARSLRELVTGLGVVARERPLLVAIWTLVAACVLAALSVGAARFAHRTNSVAASNRSAAVALAQAPARPVQTPSASTVAAAPPSVFVVTPLMLPMPSASAERERPSPSNPEIAQAVEHLAAGRDAQAKAAYQWLAARSPEDPAFAVAARLLERLASPACAVSGSATNTSCPEIKR